jgi:hypothetical protein
MGAYLHRWDSTYSILQIPLDLEIRSASTPKHYFLHFPYFQPPKVFCGLPNYIHPAPPLWCHLAPHVDKYHKIFTTYLTLSIMTLPAIITKHTERMDQDGPQVEDRVFIPYPGMPTSCSSLLNIIFPIPCSLFLLVCFNFLSCMWDVNIFTLHFCCTKKIYLTYLLIYLFSTDRC